MKNARFLLIIPALLLSSCDESYTYGTKIKAAKAQELIEEMVGDRDIEPPTSYTVDFNMEQIEGDKQKTTTKVRYKLKAADNNLYYNIKYTSNAGTAKKNYNIQYYVFTDTRYGQIDYMKVQELTTEAEQEIAMPRAYSYYYTQPAIFSDFDFSELSYFLQLGTNQSFAWSALETYSKEDYLDSDDDFTYKRNFYSSGKGNIVMKINVNNKVKNSKYDYEETKSGFILVIIENYLAKKVESNQTSVYGNENKFKLEYSYPKALKVTPPEDWESALPVSYKKN